MIDVCCALIEISTPQGGLLTMAARKGLHSHLTGLWEFPGGKLEPGESARDAVIREIREELDCEIEELRALPPYEHDYGTHAIRLIPFICRPSGNSFPSCREHAALAFLSPQRLASLPWAPADRSILNDYLASLQETEGI